MQGMRQEELCTQMPSGWPATSDGHFDLRCLQKPRWVAGNPESGFPVSHELKIALNAGALLCDPSGGQHPGTLSTGNQGRPHRGGASGTVAMVAPVSRAVGGALAGAEGGGAARLRCAPPCALCGKNASVRATLWPLPGGTPAAAPIIC